MLSACNRKCLLLAEQSVAAVALIGVPSTLFEPSRAARLGFLSELLDL